MSRSACAGSAGLRRAGVAPAATYQQLVRRYFKGALKPPFNRAGRDAAGLAEQFYTPLASA